MNKDNSTKSTELLSSTHLPVIFKRISALKPSSIKLPLFLLISPLSPLSLSPVLTLFIPFISYHNKSTCLYPQLYVTPPPPLISSHLTPSFLSTSDSI